ncbi:glycosyltransferase family 9 protein [Muricauda sp. CAU 1633]|uniref:glycosyltransferase family 9 protein n=1 Tax=Allomuricauda sp. CAU 1633 TaxID=2816036 RepID=UPI001A90C25B|nr:glycosyltransferase family 9 protein [Muricauda sp. CAU 1633]MBO0322027.1 glycosyltransferase family 9 protein [Muricauda sp. CAU 1633]
MKKFLVIQQKMVGDVLASTILCEHLKIHFPDSEVHYVINDSTLAVVEGNPFVDKIILFEKKNRESKLAFYRFLKSIKKEDYYATIDVYCKLESNLISYFSKADLKISYRKWYSKFIYTHLFSYSHNEKTTLGHAIENRLLLLSPLIKELEKPDLAPKIHLLDSENEEARQFLQEHDVDTSNPIIMVGLLGSQPCKSYPLDYLAKTLDFISEKCPATFLLNYMPDQKDSVTEFLSHCTPKTRNRIREDVFCPSLRSVIGLFGQCNAYIGNEGGCSNISKALGLPNFSIFSPWISKTAWFTFNENSKNQAVHLADFKPEILSIPKKQRKKAAADLYQTFKPIFFQKQLERFIETEVIPNQ